MKYLVAYRTDMYGTLEEAIIDNGIAKIAPASSIAVRFGIKREPMFFMNEYIEASEEVFDICGLGGMSAYYMVALTEALDRHNNPIGVTLKDAIAHWNCEKSKWDIIK